MWNGPVEEGERALQPLRDVAEPIVDLYGEIPYTALQSMIDDPPGKRNWWTAEYLDDLPDEALDAFVAYCEQMPLSFTQMLLLPWGGEVARRTDTPMAKREATWVVHPFCVWDGADRDDEHIAWGRAGRDVLAPWRAAASTSTSSATRARIACAPRSAMPTSGSPPSRSSTTRRTSSAATRTSGRRGQLVT